MDSPTKDVVAEDAALTWDPQVAALVGPALAAAERDLDRILSPAEIVMFLWGYRARMEHEVMELRDDLGNRNRARQSGR